MNETFKTFIRQVKGETYSPIGLSTIYGMQKMYGMSELELQNFAELIIRDVLSSVWDEVQYSTSQSIANEIDEKLKKYFVIE